MKALSLNGHTALVTGSSRGIGLAIALGMKEAGADVAFQGNRTAPDDVPGDALFVATDLTRPGAPAELVERIVAEKPGLDLLVCNAGSFFDVPFLEMTDERWEQTMNLNVKQTYFLTQAFARHLVAEKRPGAVVIVSSVNGFQAETTSTAYDTSKGALIMMSRTLAAELADHAIRVNCLAPGLIRTPLTAPWIDKMHDKRRHYEKKILLGRIGASEDCAGAAVFLCSPAASYITGELLTVDGGLTAVQNGKM